MPITDGDVQRVGSAEIGLVWFVQVSLVRAFGFIVINSFSNCSSPLSIYSYVWQRHRRRCGFEFVSADYLDSASAAASRGFGFVGVELSGLVWNCMRGVDSAKYLDSASTAKYLNIWIWLRWLCVDLASVDCGFGFGV